MATFHHHVTLDTDDGPMPTYIVAPEGHEPHPGVLVIQGFSGMGSSELGVAERLAANGYVAVVPDLFHRGPGCFSEAELEERRAKMTDSKVIADVNLAIAHLRAQPEVIADRIGIVGFCMGGRVSYMMAGANTDIKAAAVFYGGGVHDREGGPSPLERTPQIRCPVIIFDGEQDRHPSPDEVRKTEAELDRCGVVHEVHIYPEVGHAFMSARGTRARPEVIEDAWTRLLGWFEQHLAAEPALARG
jgi:carboxymethylenebutenolidase